ncbi:phospholipid carrier-dependent glycosyltransferase [soil metagenome]
MTARAWGWLAPISVALFAFVLRVWNLGRPKTILFDETYYAKDAYSLLKHGYVRDFVESANTRIQSGNLRGLMTDDPTQIVHPDGGKWIIAIGEQLWGLNSFGWRFSAAVVGSLTVLVLARLVLRLTGSVVIGCLAGFLLAIDGMHFVMSRLALLDVFLVFWIVCAVACLVADRDWIGARLDRRHLIRPWQIGAGICFGMACGTKWSAIYVLAAFGILTVAWEVLLRRRAGSTRNIVTSILVVGAPAFVAIIGFTAITYLATWTGWLIHHDAYEARFGHGYGSTNPPWGAYVDDKPSTFFGKAIQALRSLWHFHVMTYDFHTGSYLAGKTHPYQSNPLGWLILERPVGVDAINDLPASSCGAAKDSTCMRQVLILGNPVIWWSGALALIVALIEWIRSGDWRWGIPVAGLAATWLPWFMYGDRPIFAFYALATLPFTIIALSMIAFRVVRRAARHSARMHKIAWGVVGAYALLALVIFGYFYPIYTDQLISHEAWMSRMWFTSWI